MRTEAIKVIETSFDGYSYPVELSLEEAIERIIKWNSNQSEDIAREKLREGSIVRVGFAQYVSKDIFLNSSGRHYLPD